MTYLDEMNLQLENQNFPGFLELWKEYCSNHEIQVAELLEILENVKESEYRSHFGPYAEEGLDLLDRLDEPAKEGEILKLIYDLQTTNSEKLAQTALAYLEKNYEQDSSFKEKIRLVGLRKKDSFQGAIRNFELLSHMAKGKFIYHTSGWGVGEIIDLSLIREQLSIEFENVVGVKELSFKNAFTTLVPVSEDHFLARRFGNPDLLEKEAKEDPLKVFKMMLTDLGPLNAQEIKNEMCEVVIAADEWTKWWQNVRSKAKKDTHIQTPESLNQPFILLDKSISHADSFKELLEKNYDLEKFLQESYQFVKMFPEVLKESDLKSLFREKLLHYLHHLEESQDLLKLEIYIFLEEFFNDHLDQALIKIVQNADDFEYIMNTFHVSALKKRLLELVRKHRKDWPSIFSETFLNIPQHFLRDYVLKELMKPEESATLKATLKKLIEHPVMYPECFVWYFQKIQTEEDLPYSDLDGKRLFLEGLFILLYHIENKSQYNELTKKIHLLITKKHFQLFRDNIVDSPIEFVREILLLITKCQIFNSHDFKVFQSLAKVVHPNLQSSSVESEEDDQIIWTTQEGYRRIQERVQHIATIETIENAKEIEIARSYGDLRENSEYKFAQEKRARLQSEMKLLSSQLSHARILSPDDISEEKVGVGVVVEVINGSGKKLNYTILGPWDADPDKSILSFQSQLAKAMRGKKVNETFKFKEELFKVASIRSYLGNS